MLDPQYLRDEGEVIVVPDDHENYLLLIGGVMKTREFQRKLLDKGIYHEFDELFPEWQHCNFRRIIGCTSCGMQTHLPDRTISLMYEAQKEERAIRINCIFCAASTLKDKPKALFWYLSRLHPCLGRLIDD